MPEIDRDLFQVLSLALLLIAVLVLLAMLSTLSRVSKILQDQLTHLKDGSLDRATPTSLSEEEPASLIEEEDDVDDLPLLASPSLSEPEPITDAPGPVSGDDLPLELSQDYAAGDQWGSTPLEPAVAGDESGADAFAGLADASDPETSSVSPSDQAVDPFTGETAGVAGTGALGDEPFSSQTGIEGGDEFDRGADSSVTAASTQEEEQPFERNGRWYFRRDGELLVYDEGTGEWVAAESGGQEAASSWEEPELEDAGTSAVGEPDQGTDETAQFDSFEQPEASEEPAAAGGFWKCSSCGAVNGSTASTCRMCFAARP